jgi:hypothetical protein
MKQELHQPPRKFSPYSGLTLFDMGDVVLEIDEQLTFRTPSGGGNDVLRKEWGFYLTNSLNANLRAQGLKTALVSSGSEEPRLYVLIVEEQKLDVFHSYLDQYRMKLVAWLDEWTLGNGERDSNAPV